VPGTIKLAKRPTQTKEKTMKYVVLVEVPWKLGWQMYSPFNHTWNEAQALRDTALACGFRKVKIQQAS